MKNNEQPNMLSVTALVKFLIDTWRESKCPYTDRPENVCTNCEYNVLCSKIDELSKVVNK